MDVGTLVRCPKHKRTRGRNALPDVNPPASRTFSLGNGHVQGGGSEVRAVGIGRVWGKGVGKSTKPADFRPARQATRHAAATGR